LKHVKMNDKSAPVIPKDVHIRVPITEGLLEAGKEKFNSALSTAKKVAHTIGEKTQQVAHTLEEKIGYKFPLADQKEEFIKFVDPLASPKDLLLVKSQLKHTQTLDKSKPVIEKDLHIKKNSHIALFAEIKQRHDLKHATITHDASLPFIDKDIHIKESPQKKVFADIRQHHQLKHVKMNDKSAPVIPKDVHIRVPITEGLLEAGKERFNSALSTAKQVAHTVGEKTQKVAHTLEEKIGYTFSSADQKEEFKYVDPLASPKDLEVVKSHLKHTQTLDKSKPVIEKDVRINQNHLTKLYLQKSNKDMI